MAYFLTFPKVFVIPKFPLYLNYEIKRRQNFITQNSYGMKLYFPKAAGAVILLALLATASFAQDDKKEEKKETIRKSEDVIVITPKTSTDTKLTIEIKGDDIKVNGKPLSEYKDDDVNISRRKHFDMLFENQGMAELDPLRAPNSRFRSNGGASVFGFGDSDNLAWSGSSNKAFLGVGSEKSKEGASITSISKGSGAEKAGLKEDDIITKLDETKITSPEDLTKTIGKYKPDDKVTVTYLRDKKEMKTTATLGKRKTSTTIYAPDAFKSYNFDNGQNYSFSYHGKARLGLKAQETEDGKGLKVLSIDDESTAEKAGIKEGDIITSFDGTEVNTVEKLGELAKAAIEKNNFKIKLNRDGKSQEVEVKIPKKLKTTSL